MSDYRPPIPPQPSSMGHGVRIGIGIVIGIFVIVLLSMGACVACGGLMFGLAGREAARQSTSPSTDPASMPRVGQRVERSGIALTVENTSKSKSLGRFDTADQNNIYRSLIPLKTSPLTRMERSTTLADSRPSAFEAWP